MTTPARELATATQLFLARHAEALASGEGSRTLAAVEGLLLALDETLPAEIDAARGGAGEEPRLDALPALAGAQREAWAHATLRRRAAECEGILLQLQLALRNLANGEGDAAAASPRGATGPAGPVSAFRLVALLTATRATLRGLEQAIHLWAQALEGEAAAAPPGPTTQYLKAARESLLAGAPEAAAPALRRALVATRVPAALAAEAQALDRALAAGTPDPIAGWALLDAVDALAARAAITPRP